MAKTYYVSFRLTVTDARALRRAAAQLAQDVGIAGWEAFRRSTQDDLTMLLDPGTLPGAEIIVVCSPEPIPS